MKKITAYAFVFTLFILVLFIKPISIYILETSLSSLLETPVKTIDFKLLSLDLLASIKEDDNLAHVKVNSLYPLQVDATYEGNIDAFKVYHPLKAQGKLSGTVAYKDHLDINAELLTMGAELNVSVQEEGANWAVRSDIKGLDLHSLQKENNLSVNMSGLLDAKIDFHTQKDFVVKISSPKIKVHKQELKELNLSINDDDHLIQVYALFDAPNIDYKGVWFNYKKANKSFDARVDLRVKRASNDMLLELKGEHNDTTVSAHLDGHIAASKFFVKNILYDLDTSAASADIDIQLKQIQRHQTIIKEFGLDLQGELEAKARLLYKNEKLFLDINTQSLGGDLQALYQDDALSWKAKSLSVQKILHILKMNQNMVSFIDTEGTFNEEGLRASLETNSLKIDKTEIKDLQISTEGKLDDLRLQASAKTPYAHIQKASLHLTELKDINLSAALTTPYTNEPISLEGQVTYENAQGELTLQAHSKEFKLDVYRTVYKDEVLSGNYKALIYPELSKLKEELHLKGDFSYIEDLVLVANTKDFGGKLRAELQGEQIDVKGKNIKIQRLLSQLKTPSYLKGKADLYMRGNFDKQSFSLQSRRLTLDKKETGLDENLSCAIKGNLNSKRLYIQPEIINRYLHIEDGNISFKMQEEELSVRLPIRVKHEDQHLNLELKTELGLKKGIEGRLELRNEKDFFILKDLSYKEKKLYTKAQLHINDLNAYAKILKQEFYGPVDIDAKVKYADEKPDLSLTTDSLGGELNVLLKDKDLEVKLEDILVTKVGYLMKKDEGASTSGKVNGLLLYNLKKKQGDMELTGRDIQVKGIDIDKTLQEYQDILGLNIFAMGDTLVKSRLTKNDDMNLSTQVKHVELDVEITPELIISKDVAMATANNRFAMNTSLKHNGDIKDFEIAILDIQGCAVVRQKLKGNIKSPKLVDTKGTAVVVLGQAPIQILNTGGKIVTAGAGLLDSAASFVWEKGLRQDSKVTLVKDTLTKGSNIFSSGKDMIVSGECKVFYTGAVQAP